MLDAVMDAVFELILASVPENRTGRIIAMLVLVATGVVVYLALS